MRAPDPDETTAAVAEAKRPPLSVGGAGVSSSTTENLPPARKLARPARLVQPAQPAKAQPPMRGRAPRRMP
ncbi:hypothetical protein, partial [Burkholderia humptydooensis]|uniref:hypothetical protein n=1 Tax=Burkholderia humptydooensis TaxID=430531 RepID=UPI00016AFAE0